MKNLRSYLPSNYVDTVKTADLWELGSILSYHILWISPKPKKINWFTLIFTCFHWFSDPVVIFFLSYLAFCELCLFQLQWLTHSCHVITSWLTSHRLADCTGNEMCREGGRFREIPDKRVSPYQENPLEPLSILLYTILQHPQRP